METTCEDCGSKEAVKTICPYSKYAYDKIVEISVCDTCYKEREENLSKLKAK